MVVTTRSSYLTTAAGRADAQRRVHAALAFAQCAGGRATLHVRRAVAALGPFGAVLLALYPVAAVMGLVPAGLGFAGQAGI